MRVEVPDVALAEAAIGAGLTAALLMEALARLGMAASPGSRNDNEEANHE